MGGGPGPAVVLMEPPARPAPKRVVHNRRCTQPTDAFKREKAQNTSQFPSTSSISFQLITHKTQTRGRPHTHHSPQSKCNFYGASRDLPTSPAAASQCFRLSWHVERQSLLCPHIWEPRSIAPPLHSPRLKERSICLSQTSRTGRKSYFALHDWCVTLGFPPTLAIRIKQSIPCAHQGFAWSTILFIFAFQICTFHFSIHLHSCNSRTSLFTLFSYSYFAH